MSERCYRGAASRSHHGRCRHYNVHVLLPNSKIVLTLYTAEVTGFKNGRCCYFPLKGIHVSHCFATPVVSYRLKRNIFPMYPLVSIKPWSKEGILKMHSGHFMMIVWLRITQVMREETHCRLVVISSKESSICIIKQRLHV